MIVMRFIDIYWNVQPAHWRSVHVHWLDAATLVGVGGLWLAVFMWQLARGPWLRETVPETRRSLTMSRGPATHDLPAPASRKSRS